MLVITYLHTEASGNPGDFTFVHKGGIEVLGLRCQVLSLEGCDLESMCGWNTVTVAYDV